MKQTLKLASICSGYGGLDLSVERHFKNKGFDVETVWFVEKDKKCSQILSHHWPDVPNYGDVKTVDWETVSQPDIMVAGYPCQPFSVAGNRLGEKDERSIFEYIAEGISTLRPKWVILENVQGHLSLGGANVTSEVARLGYSLRYGIVRASDAGAPHRRARWFCIATDSSCERYGSGEDDTEVGRVAGEVESEAQQQRTWQKPVHRVPKDYGEYATAIERWERITRPAPDELFDDDGAHSLFVEWMMGLPEGWVTGHGLTRSAELKMLGNGVVVQQGELALKLLDN
tara:strand:+ start:1895 stop:2752 length:858 start_codon:yes stop_codon:yes gene_type:complete